jgi:hypothetical protein
VYGDEAQLDASFGAGFFLVAWNCGAVVGDGIVSIVHDGPFDVQVVGSVVWGSMCSRPNGAVVCHGCGSGCEIVIERCWCWKERLQEWMETRNVVSCCRDWR